MYAIDDRILREMTRGPHTAMVFDIGVERAKREFAARGNPARRTRTGQAAPCPVPYDSIPGCVPSGCDLPATLQRRIPGYTGPCKEMRVGFDANVNAGATATITDNPRVTMCPTRMLVVVTGTAGMSLSNLRINNSSQWGIDDVFHSDMFSPGSDDNTLIKGDCFAPGSEVAVTVVNLDGANQRRIFVAFHGPAIS